MKQYRHSLEVYWDSFHNSRGHQAVKSTTASFFQPLGRHKKTRCGQASGFS
ncbi:hypothetical protein C4K40_1886 [Pseudomonas sp. CMR5c]|nr:hypothetical protein C4K40_1886 [Pseudomonas sp. CMR5c]